MDGQFWRHFSTQPVGRLKTHLAPPRADYEQVFAGANFNTEKISGAHVEVSGAHFKMLAIIKVSGAPLKASLKSPEHNLMK